MEEMRINKYLASLGIASRREVDKMIEEGYKNKWRKGYPSIKVSDKDEIYIRGKKIEKHTEKKVYYILNKPLEVLTHQKMTEEEKL